jgi:hypothetical protein
MFRHTLSYLQGWTIDDIKLINNINIRTPVQISGSIFLPKSPAWLQNPHSLLPDPSMPASVHRSEWSHFICCLFVPVAPTRSIWSSALMYWVTSPLTAQVLLNPDVTARAIWQAVRRLGWEMAAEFYLRNISILRHGTDGFTSPPKKVLLRIFITLKNPSPSVGIEPANLGSSGEHANH